MQFALNAGPSVAAWNWGNQIVAQAVLRGWRVLDRDSAESLLLGQPDWLLCGPAETGVDEAVDVVVLGPDFTAADLGGLDVAQLSERFAAQVVPDVEGTRWFSSAFVAAVAARHMRLIDSEVSVIEINGLGSLKRPDDLGDLRSGDPALGIYRTPLFVGAKAFWSSDLFAAAKHPILNGAAWLDVTGRAKSVAEDPGMQVLAGLWSIDWLIEVDPEGGFVELVFQWGDQVFTKAIDRPGLYSVTQSAAWPDGGPVVARIASSRPHFQGRVRFAGAAVTYLGAFLPQNPETLEPLEEL